MPKRQRIIALILVGIFLISLGEFIISRLRFPVRREKGIFAEGVVGHIRVVNPLFVDFNDADRDISQLVFSGLIKHDPVERNFLPDLATNWERSRDGLTYTITLRTDALWHDGTPVTVDDVIFTFRDVIGDPGLRNPILKNTFENVAVSVTAPNTITFTLPKQNSYFISNLTVGILPKHLLENTAIANLEKSPFNKRPIGSGPYQVTSLKVATDGDVIDLTSFPNYYGPKPNLERLRFYTFPDEESLMEERDAFHALSKFSPSSEKVIGGEQHFSLYPYTLNQFTALYFNTSHPLLKDKRVRRALTRGLDKDKLLSEGETRVDSLDLSAHPTDSQFSWNQDAAAQVLDNVGLRMGHEGFRINNKGEKISLTLLATSRIPQQLLEDIRNQWQTLGIQIQIEQVDAEDFSKYVSERRFDVLLIRQNLGYNRDVYPLFHSSQIGQQGLNFSNFKSFQTDGLTEAIRKEQNPPDKEKLLEQLGSVIAEEVPIIFLSTPVYSYALDKRSDAFPVRSLDFHSDRLSILPYLSFQNL